LENFSLFITLIHRWLSEGEPLYFPALMKWKESALLLPAERKNGVADRRQGAISGYFCQAKRRITVLAENCYGSLGETAISS